MKTTRWNLTHVMIAIGALALSMAAKAAPTQPLNGRAVTIRAVAVSGSEVAITVTNHTGRTQTGTVDTQALTIGGEVRVTTPYTAPAGHTTTVTVVLPERVLDDGLLGVVVDDGVPF